MQLILRFFNLNLTLGITAEKMCLSFITLIQKEGNKSDLDNYRGICVANALLKLLCTVMEERLRKFCAKNKLIDIEQIGFMEENRAPDHIFTLKSVVNKYVTNEKGKKLYACFVDFRKAFDSVWHEGLFHKLESMGIGFIR